MAGSRELLGSLYPIVRALRRMEEDAAATQDLRMWQYAVLSVVRAAPGANQGTVAEELDYSRNRIIADLDDLEAKGLLTRTPGADRRSNELHVTDAGRRAHDRIRRAIRRGEDELLATLPETRREQLRRTLAGLADDVRAR